MSKGYVVAATTEYVHLAYMLARSSALHGNPPVSLIVENPSDVSPSFHTAFDKIISVGSEPRRKYGKFGLSAMFNHSPYEQTVCMDADMIFLDHDTAWDRYTTDISWGKAVTFRGQPVPRTCRAAFDDLCLPDFYVAWMYFRAGDTSYAFFELARELFLNWDMYRDHLAVPYKFTLAPSTDVVFALAALLLNLTPGFQQEFVHYKSDLQVKPDSVVLGANLFLGMRRQYLPFHYHDKDWATRYPKLWGGA